jgi:hypothetical protein
MNEVRSTVDYNVIPTWLTAREDVVVSCMVNKLTTFISILSPN